MRHHNCVYIELFMIGVLGITTVFSQDKPAARVAHQMAYDESRKVFVMFGGMSPQLLADTWEFDGKTWKQVASDGPPKRAVHAMAYDKNRKVTVLFGGKAENDRDYLGDTWIWDGKVWKQTTLATSPSPRFFHLMIYDEVLKAVVLLAGGQGGEAINDAWEWTGEDWKKLDTPPAPMPTAEAFVYDPQEKAWLIFGGSVKFGQMSNQIFRLKGGKWVEAP